MQNVELYNASNIDSLPWPETEEGDYAKRYLVPMIKEGTKKYFENLETEVLAVKVDNMVLPVTVNNGEYDNCYVCSPYGQYIHYAYDEITKGKKGSFKVLMKLAMAPLRFFLKRCKINKIVFINNWLLNTTLYPSMTKEQIKRVKTVLAKKFPKHAIAFRSINPAYDKKLYRDLVDEGFLMVGSRRVFILDGKSGEPFKARMFKSDLKLLQSAGYEVLENEQLNQEHSSRILELYRSLYLEKYSAHNLQLTKEFVDLAVKERLLQFKAIRKNGVIDGVMGAISQKDVINSPLFGHNEESGVYRILSTLLSLDAKNSGKILNMSSGASSFKKLRRASPAMEYTAVYTSHLRFYRALPWLLIKFGFDAFGQRILDKRGL